MYAEDIYTAASAICGESSELLGLLSAAAEEELLYRLKKDVDVKSIEPLFIASAAMLAASMYVGVSDSGVKKYTAGSVSVEYGGENLPSSEVLRKRSELLLAGYLDGGGFDFVGVNG